MVKIIFSIIMASIIMSTVLAQIETEMSFTNTARDLLNSVCFETVFVSSKATKLRPQVFKRVKTLRISCIRLAHTHTHTHTSVLSNSELTCPVYSTPTPVRPTDPTPTDRPDRPIRPPSVRPARIPPRRDSVGWRRRLYLSTNTSSSSPPFLKLEYCQLHEQRHDFILLHVLTQT